MENDLTMLRNEVEQLSNKKIHDDIVEQLKKINECFLTNYKLNFEFDGKTINIIPIEAEIYYHNENIDKNIFEDKMIHKNYLQNNNFGKLYFHRIKNNIVEIEKKKQEPIDLKSCGVDVCVSNGNYYLSILIRSALIEGEMISGINKICRKIKEILKPEGCLQCFFYDLEDINVIQKRTEYINIENIRYQKRIAGDHPSKKNNEELNCLNLGKNDEYLDNIINTGQTFYKKYKDSEEKEEYKKSLSRN